MVGGNVSVPTLKHVRVKDSKGRAERSLHVRTKDRLIQPSGLHTLLCQAGGSTIGSSTMSPIMYPVVTLTLQS